MNMKNQLKNVDYNLYRKIVAERKLKSGGTF